MNKQQWPLLLEALKKNNLTWFGLVERMSQKRTVKKVFKNTPEEEKCVEKPRKRSLDDIDNDLKKMGIRGLRKIARDRNV